MASSQGRDEISLSHQEGRSWYGLATAAGAAAGDTEATGGVEKGKGPLPRIGVSRVPVEIGLSWTLGPTSGQPTALQGLWEKVWLWQFRQKQSLALSELA